MGFTRCLVVIAMHVWRLIFGLYFDKAAEGCVISARGVQQGRKRCWELSLFFEAKNRARLLHSVNGGIPSVVEFLNPVMIFRRQHRQRRLVSRAEVNCMGGAYSWDRVGRQVPKYFQAMSSLPFRKVNHQPKL